MFEDQYHKINKIGRALTEISNGYEALVSAIADMNYDGFLDGDDLVKMKRFKEQMDHTGNGIKECLRLLRHEYRAACRCYYDGGIHEKYCDKW